MNESFFDQDGRQSPKGYLLDFKRVIARALRFWYVVVFSLAVSLGISFYKTRYTKRTYPVNASIVLRETQEISGGEFLYKNNLIDAYRNYLNEPYIIKSIPLIEGVVLRNHFNIGFYQEGYLLTSEVYDYFPVKAMWCGPSKIFEGVLRFEMIDTARYMLQPFSNHSSVNGIFSLGDTINFLNFRLCLRKTSNAKLDGFVHVPLLLSIQNPKVAAGSFVSRLQVEWAEEGAGIINLGLTGTTPEKEVDFLYELIKGYQELDLKKKNETADRSIEFIHAELKDIKDSLRSVERDLELMGNASRSKDLGTEAERLLKKLDLYQAEMAEVAIRSNYFKYLKNYLDQDRTDQVILPGVMGIDDQVLSSLLTKMINLQLETRQFVGFDSPENPLLAGKIKQIHEVKKDVAEAMKSVQHADDIRADFVTREISEVERLLKHLPATERQLVAIQRNYSLLENLYVFLMQKLSEAQISRASNTSDIIMVNPPSVGGAISPKPLQNYAVATVIGLLIPFILFVVFELLNNRVQSREDIELMTRIPFIGGIGHNTSQGNLTVKERPKSGVAESFRALRSSLNYFTANKSKQIFMVGSSISGEGKTFTTINLATVFALSGKRTLIVGADMRRPKIFEDFHGHNNVGLSTFLSEISDFENIVQETSINNLSFVSGGPVPPNPSELLMTDRFEVFIKKSLAAFDYVIIDTPPLALVTDAFVISKFVNHTVFVLRQNYTPKDFIKSIDEYHRSGKLENISILLNDIYKSGLGYGYGQGYAYQYGYSYGYGRRSKGSGYYEE